jgi:LysM repeat protein
VRISQSKKEADVIKRIALVLALVTIVAMVAAPVALADENESGWWGNIVGFPSTVAGAICLDAVDGSTVGNCHAQDPLRPYEPIKFDGMHPGMYIATSDAFHAFVYAYPGQDNWVNWGWMVPLTWHYPMPVPMAPGFGMWTPGGAMTHDGPPLTMVDVDQFVDVTGSGKVGQSVDVKSPGPSVVKVDQLVNMKSSTKSGGPVAIDGGKCACFTYVVKCGDSLSKIAVRYGDTVSGLVSRNHIANANKIRIGQRITVCDP